MAKLAFAHYSTRFPMQITTAPYPGDHYATSLLSPTGEGSGGWGPLLRDRPLPPGPVTGDWALNNAKTEIAQATAGLIDGFMVGITTEVTDGSDDASKFGNAVFAAAVAVGGFYAVPVLDLSALSALSAAQAAAVLNHYLSYACAWQESGSYVFSASPAETWTTTKWGDVITALSATHGKTAKFLPRFASATPVDGGTYDSVAWGMTMSPGRSPASADLTTWTNRGNAVQGRSRKWMAPIAFQGESPSEGLYDEACNTETLRLCHEAARANDADYLLLDTWNDYAQGTAMAPSRDKGDVIVLVSKHYTYWWLNPGTEPTVYTTLGRELVVLSHRKQFAADKPSYPETSLMTLRPGSTAARDTVEALAFLGSPGTLVLASGSSSFNFPLNAGVTAKSIPLQVGIQKASIARTPAPPTPPPTPTPTGWKLVWADEFETLDTSKWNIRTDTQSNHQGHNSAANVNVSGSMVKLNAGINTGSDSGTKPWTSAYMTTAGKFAFPEGRVDVRARMNWGYGGPGQGIWPAIWFRPEDGGIGEIDLMEAWLGISVMHPSLWRDYTGTPHVEKPGSTPGFDPTAWHVWRLEKEKGRLQMFLDDVLWWDATNSASWRAEAFDRTVNWHVRLQIQVGASYGGVPDGGTDFSKTFDIDYVRYYSR